ncbi:MAG: twin-arginine translocation signal domain-containing protein [Desulfovibrionaceae bacterium]|nr:twin-arginine translocation signal domain-containing protein [Desulfovibrionaceae bacterium]
MTCCQQTNTILPADQISIYAFHAATNQRSTKMKEQDFKVEQSSTTKLNRRSFLKGSVAVAAGGLAAAAAPGS